MSELTAIAPQITAVLGWTLIHFVWQATVIAAALGFGLQLIPRGFAGRATSRAASRSR